MCGKLFTELPYGCISRNLATAVWEKIKKDCDYFCLGLFVTLNIFFSPCKVTLSLLVRLLCQDFQDWQKSSNCWSRGGQQTRKTDTKLFAQSAAGTQMPDSSLLHEQTHGVHIAVGVTSIRWGSCISAGSHVTSCEKTPHCWSKVSWDVRLWNTDALWEPGCIVEKANPSRCRACVLSCRQCMRQRWICTSLSTNAQNNTQPWSIDAWQPSRSLPLLV